VPLPLRAGDGHPPLRGRAPAVRIATVSGTLPSTRPVRARYMAIEPGRRRNSFCPSRSSQPARFRSRSACRLSCQPPFGVSRRSSRPSSWPLLINAPTYSTLSNGLARNRSSGSAFIQRAVWLPVYSYRMAGAASSIRPAARSKSPPASGGADRIRWRPFCSYHSLARRCRAG